MIRALVSGTAPGKTQIICPECGGSGRTRSEAGVYLYDPIPDDVLVYEPGELIV